MVNNHFPVKDTILGVASFKTLNVVVYVQPSELVNVNVYVPKVLILLNKSTPL